MWWNYYEILTLRENLKIAIERRIVCDRDYPHMVDSMTAMLLKSYYCDR